MQIIEHNQQSFNVCIYEHTKDFLRGSFFAQKPKVGDYIDSSVKHGYFRVDEILKNEDAIISDTCSKNPELANFELRGQQVIEIPN